VEKLEAQEQVEKLEAQEQVEVLEHLVQVESLVPAELAEPVIHMSVKLMLAKHLT